MKTRLHWGAVFLLTLLLVARPLAAQDDRIAHDFQLRGLMGGKLKIEMHLTTEDHEGLVFPNGQCITAFGRYYYRTQLKAIPLRGRFCLANHSFYLEDQPSPGTTERFEGKWDGKTRRLSGTWSHLSSGKTMPFELAPIDVGVAAADFQKYYNYLNETLTVEPDAEGARIESASWTPEGGKISGFQPEWKGYIEFISPMRFAFSTGYTSTARSSSYYSTYQLLPSSHGLYLLYLGGSSNYDKGYGDEEDEPEGSESCEEGVAILHYENGGWEDVTSNLLPTGSQIESHCDSFNCEAMILSDAILLPGGAKLYWDGSKFVGK